MVSWQPCTTQEATHQHVVKQGYGLGRRLQQPDQLRDSLVLARSAQGGHQGVGGGRVEAGGDL